MTIFLTFLSAIYYASCVALITKCWLHDIGRVTYCDFGLFCLVGWIAAPFIYLDHVNWKCPIMLEKKDDDHEPRN